jgi:hypothetical protein
MVETDLANAWSYRNENLCKEYVNSGIKGLLSIDVCFEI